MKKIIDSSKWLSICCARRYRWKCWIRI